MPCRPAASTLVGPFLAIFAILILALASGARCAELSGTVRSEDGPVSGAQVTLTGPDTGTGRQRQLTDAAGHYRFPEVADGEYFLQAKVPGRDYALEGDVHGLGLPVEVRAGQPEVADLALRGGGNGLRIRFQAPGEAPPLTGDATIPELGKFAAIRDGLAELDGLPPGTARAQYHTNLGDGTATAAVRERGITEVTVTLAMPPMLEGVARGTDGQPLAGVRYRPARGWLPPQATGADGVFRVAQPASGPAAVALSHPDYLDTTVLFGAGSGRVSVTLRRGGGPITGAFAGYESDSLRDCAVRGTPVTGEGRAWRPFSRPKEARPDGHGRFALQGLPEGQVAVEASCRDREAKEDTVATGADLGSLRLRPSLPLEGTVIDASDRSPVDTFTLAVYADPSEANRRWAFMGAQARAHPGGKFSVPSEREGRNAVCVSAAGYQGPTCAEYRTGGAAPEPQVLELKPGLRLTVAVTGPDGPLASQPVRLRSPGRRAPAFPAATGPDGRAVFAGLSPGRYGVEVRAACCRAYAGEVDLRGDQRLDVRLEGGLAISGRLLEAGGEPAEGWRLAAFGGGRAVPGSAGQGNFEVTGLDPGAYDLVVGRGNGYWMDAPVFRLPGVAAGTRGLDLRLPPARDWRIVAYLRGAPARLDLDFRVTITDQAGDAPEADYGGGPPHRAKGEYTFPARAGMRYRVRVDGDGCLPRTRVVAVPAGSGPFLTRIDLLPALSLRGKVVDDSGRPARGYGVAWLDRAGGGDGPRGPWRPGPRRGRRRPQATDAQGAFTLAEVPPGPHPLLIRDPDDRPALLAWAAGEAGGPVRTFILPRPASLAGHARDRAGDPRPGAGLRLFPRWADPYDGPDRRFALAGAKADRDGAFAFHRIPPGTYLLCYDGPGPCARARAAAGETLRIDPPPPGPAFAVRVDLDLPAAAPDPEWARLYGDGFAAAARLSGGEGGDGPVRAEFDAVPAGRYRLLAAAGGGGRGGAFALAESLSVDAGHTRFRAYVPARGPVLRPRGPRGENMPGFVLSITPLSAEGAGPGPAWPALARADASGALTFLGLAPGGYRLRLGHPRFAIPPLDLRLDPAEKPQPAALAPAGTGIRLTVRVTYGGYPLPGAKVEVRDSADAPWPVVAGEADGEYDAGALPAGAYRLRAGAPGCAALERSVRLRAGRDAEAEVEIALGPGGYVETPPGQGRSWYLRDARGTSIPPSIRDPGGDLFAGLLPGEYAIWITGEKQARGQVRVEAGQVAAAR